MSHARLRRYLADHRRKVTVEELDAQLGFGNDPTTYVRVLAMNGLRDSSTDDEVRRLLEGHSPGPLRASEWARALGFAGEDDMRVQRAAERSKLEAAAGEKRARYLRDRRELPELRDDEREILDVLLVFGHRPALPDHCFDRQRFEPDDMAVRRAAGALALLAAWRAEDKPRDLEQWMRRTYGAAVTLPPAALPRDERLEGLFRRYSRP